MPLFPKSIRAFGETSLLALSRQGLSATTSRFYDIDDAVRFVKTAASKSGGYVDFVEGVSNGDKIFNFVISFPINAEDTGYEGTVAVNGYMSTSGAVNKYEVWISPTIIPNIDKAKPIPEWEKEAKAMGDKLYKELRGKIFDFFDRNPKSDYGKITTTIKQKVEALGGSVSFYKRDKPEDFCQSFDFRLTFPGPNGVGTIIFNGNGFGERDRIDLALDSVPYFENK